MKEIKGPRYYIENRYFAVPLTMPLFYESKRPLLPAFISLAVSIVLLGTSAALFVHGRAHDLGLNPFVGILILSIFGFYFLLISIHLLFHRYRLVLDPNKVQSFYHSPFKSVAMFETPDNFQAELSEYEALYLRKLKGIGKTSFSLILQHRTESSRDVLLYNNIVLRSDQDPQISKAADFFSQHLNLPIIEASK